MIWLLAVISAVLYRAAGKGGFKGAKLLRRLGCSLAAILGLLALGVKAPWYLYIITFALQYGALSTYNDWITGGHEDWRCWTVTSIFYGLSALPIIIFSGLWLGLALRTLVCLLIVPIREKSSNVWVEELSSGFLFVASLVCLTV